LVLFVVKGRLEFFMKNKPNSARLKKQIFYLVCSNSNSLADWPTPLGKAQGLRAIQESQRKRELMVGLS
jgi:hypothetical protein